MTAALYSTRLGHERAAVSRGGGRAATMQEQPEAYGCAIHRSVLSSCTRGW